MAEDLRNKPESYWRERLTPEQYHVLREGGTERPGTGKYDQHFEDGNYTCAACGAVLFDSTTKYNSTMPGLRGWPAFADLKSSETVELRDDTSLGMHRVEVICKNCGSHLGHVFDGDPDSPTGKHYCINSCSLEFDGASKAKH